MFEQPTKNVKVLESFDIYQLMPKYKDIPEEFNYDMNPYVKFQSDWFFDGLKYEDMPTARKGINLTDAIRHLSVIQKSFVPKHEHKKAAVAYLASLCSRYKNIDLVESS